MNKEIIIEANRLKEEYIFNKIAKQASGAVLYKQGKAVLIAAIAIDEEPVKEDFLPLIVQYIEKSYAAAKIPGGFVKRESKPSDFETLTSRIIDRSLRPLFPKGFNYSITITITVVSSDPEVDMQIAALHAANGALFVSDLPVSQVIGAVRVGTVGDDIVLNPTLSQQGKSELDLLVVGSGEDILMIEMRTLATQEGSIQYANEFKEEALIEVIKMAKDAIKEVSGKFEEEFKPFVKEPLELTLIDEKIDTELYDYISNNFKEEVKEAVAKMAKSERANQLKTLTQNIYAKLQEEDKSVDMDTLIKVVDKFKRFVVRDMILNDKKRADGRDLDEVRPIEIDTNFLPSVHGSALFTRGETQALVTVTLGDKKDAQMYELITDKSPRVEKFMVHYNFPGYSVGEAKSVNAPGRRELGHGNLAKRALEPCLDMYHDGTVRVVSEILESNGSSSMATICGGAIALRAAQVKTMALVAGVAMGLVKENDNYAILTDIMGLEDHDGDMDFKVAGTTKGITALQMDIKLGGLDLEVLKEALYQSSQAREHILDIMEKSCQDIQESQALPTTKLFHVHPSKIVEIIGKGGATIREIIEKFNVTIDLNRENGGVKISGTSKKNVEEAQNYIQNLTSMPVKQQMTYEIGKAYEGVIKKIVDFGLFVEMPDGYDALLHISKVDKGRIDNLDQRYKEGEKIEVVVMEQKGKKVELATLQYLA